MVAGGSPDWLPPGFTEKIKHRKGRKIKYYFNVATGKEYHSKKEVIHCATEDTSLLVTPQSKRGDGNGPISINKVDVIPEKTNDSAAWLPNGWTVEERSRKRGLVPGSTYKVYTDLASGRLFYSKAAVTRYLNSIDHADTMTNQNKSDNMVEPLPDMLLQVSPMTTTRSTCANKTKGNSLVTSDNMVEPLPDMSLQVSPMITTRSTRVNKTKGNSLVTSDNMVEPLPDMLLKVSPMTTTRSTRANKTKGISLVTRDNMDEPLPDMSLQVSPMTTTRSTRANKTKGNSLVTVSPMTNTRSTRGNKRKANSFVTIDNVDEPVPEKSPQVKSMTNTGGGHKQKKKENSRVKIDTVVEPLPDMSPQAISTTNSNGLCENKRKSRSFVTVAIERTTDDDLPTGWIKEIRTSQSGERIRKDPFYTDPVSGYMFRSKPDALRYLKTNDIRRCFCRPLKRELDEIKSSNTANEKLSMHKRQLLPGEESNGDEERSGTKSPAEPETKILKQKEINHNSVKVTAAGAVSLEEKVSCENSNKNAEMGKNPGSENDVSTTDAKAINSPVTDPSFKQQVPESEGRTKVGSRKSKKRKDSSLPSRASKRLAGSQPEIQTTLNLSERTLRAAVRVMTASVVDASPSCQHEASKIIPQASNMEPVKEAADQAVVGKETHQDVEQLKEVEKPPAESSAIPKEVEKPPAECSAILKEVEKPPAESSAIPEEPSGEKANEKPLDDGQQSQVSQLCYDFGESWSDPLEFALKTLRGEIPIEDSLTFPRCFEEQVDTTFNQVDGWLKPSQFSAPINFQSGFASHSESPKTKNDVDPLPASSPLFSPLQNAVNPLPASSPSFASLGNKATGSPSFSALGNISFSSFGGFNYQPSTEVGKKDSKTKFNP